MDVQRPDIYFSQEILDRCANLLSIMRSAAYSNDYGLQRLIIDLSDIMVKHEKKPSKNTLGQMLTTLRTIVKYGRGGFDVNYRLPESDLKGKEQIVSEAQTLLESANSLHARCAEIERWDSLTLKQVERSIPLQVPAPVRVKTENHRIVLSNEQHKDGPINFDSANRTRESLKQTLQYLIDDLNSGSNADKRYIRQCQIVLENLTPPLQDISIENLGMHTKLMEKMTHTLREELGLILFDTATHTIQGINTLLFQFREWNILKAEMDRRRIDSKEATILVAQAGEIIETSSGELSPVDASVVERFKSMIEPVLTGIIQADAIAVPLMDSIVNFVSLISNIALEGASLSQATIGDVSTVGSSAILVSFAVETLRRICPIISQFQPLKFVFDVVGFLAKHYSQLKDAFNTHG